MEQFNKLNQFVKILIADTSVNTIKWQKITANQYTCKVPNKDQIVILTQLSTSPNNFETIALYPLEGDYGLFGEEGLIGRTALMPNNPTATMNPVPEPAAMFMFGTGLIGLLGVIRKVRK